MKETGTIRPADVPADLTRNDSGMQELPQRGEKVSHVPVKKRGATDFFITFEEIMERLRKKLGPVLEKDKPPNEPFK